MKANKIYLEFLRRRDILAYEEIKSIGIKIPVMINSFYPKDRKKSFSKDELKFKEYMKNIQPKPNFEKGSA